MKVQVSFRHMDSSEAVRALCEEKSDRIKKYLHHPIDVHWFLSIEKENHRAHVKVVGKDTDFNAEADTGDMYASVDSALKKLEEQLHRWKDRVTHHH